FSRKKLILHLEDDTEDRSSLSAFALNGGALQHARKNQEFALDEDRRERVHQIIDAAILKMLLLVSALFGEPNARKILHHVQDCLGYRAHNSSRSVMKFAGQTVPKPSVSIRRHFSQSIRYWPEAHPSGVSQSGRSEQSGAAESK